MLTKGTIQDTEMEGLVRCTDEMGGQKSVVVLHAEYFAVYTGRSVSTKARPAYQLVLPSSSSGT